MQRYRTSNRKEKLNFQGRFVCRHSSRINQRLHYSEQCEHALVHFIKDRFHCRFVEYLTSCPVCGSGMDTRYLSHHTYKEYRIMIYRGDNYPNVLPDLKKGILSADIFFLEREIPV